MAVSPYSIRGRRREHTRKGDVGGALLTANCERASSREGGPREEEGGLIRIRIEGCTQGIRALIAWRNLLRKNARNCVMVSDMPIWELRTGRMNSRVIMQNLRQKEPDS